MQRRSFIAGLAAVGAAAGFPAAPRAAWAAGSPSLGTTRLTDSLTLVTGAGGNVVVFDSPEGVLLVDGGSRARSAELLQTVRGLTGKDRVHTLFNTHWHWDQTGSNAALAGSGTQILSHENTRLWLGTDVDSEWEQRRYERLPKSARPTKTFYTTGSLQFGGEQIDYGHLPQAHTDGDLYVHFRRADVIVCGDVLSVGRYPLIDYSTGGWLGGLVEATKQLAALGKDSTRFVPGVGSVQSRAAVQAENQMLGTMRTRLAKLLAEGMSAQEMVDARPSRDFDTTWGDPELFIRNAWPGLVARARELGVAIV
ncbi:MAG: Beta-lactamase precursor [Pseudomonadota bacterium]|jgi:glyoxylase-like metal-dependent hydrolase (beta-lactamase superfamily II)